MRLNRTARIGFSLLAASSLLWLGGELTRRADWIVSYAASVGALLLLIGVSSEVRRYRNAGLTAFQRKNKHGHRCWYQDRCRSEIR